MSDIKEKIEMELKPYESMCETSTDYLKELIVGGNDADPEKILTVAKVVGEIVDIKKDIVKMCYKKTILEAMEESDYEEYRDNIKNYSEPRRKYPEEYYRDRDMDMPKKMYYTESSPSDSSRRGQNGTMNNSGMKDAREGMSGSMRRNYVESKQIHGADSDEMESLEDYLKTLETDMKELKSDMTASEKSMVYNKLTNLANQMKS